MKSLRNATVSPVVSDWRLRNLDTTRKQLSHALYQHDAACRVIARLLRERDAKGTQAESLAPIRSVLQLTDQGNMCTAPA